MALIIVGALIIVFFIFLSASFSFSETALASSNKIRLNVVRKNGNKVEKKQAERVVHFIENFNEMVTTIVVINNVLNIFITTFAAFYFNRIFSNNELLASIISFIIMTFLIVLLGELIPKMYAKKYAEKGLMKVSFSLVIVRKFMIPVTYFTNLLVKQNSTSPIQSEDELIETISEAQKFGVASKDEATVIHSALKLDDTMAEDVMIKKSNTIFVYDDLKNEEYFEYAKKASVTRVPVLDESGKILKVWNIKRYIIKCLDDKNADPRDYFYSIAIYSKDDTLHKIFDDLQKRRQKIGAIVDKSNVLIGVITIEDILETLMGNMYDEFDEKADGVYKIDDTQYIVQKNVAVRYFFNTYLKENKIPSNISKTTTIEQWIVKVNRKTDRKYELKIGDQFKYGSLMIWAKQDMSKHTEIVFEVDIIN